MEAKINITPTIDQLAEMLFELDNKQVAELFGKWRPINNRTIRIVDAVYDYMNQMGPNTPYDEDDLVRYLERRFPEYA